MASAFFQNWASNFTIAHNKLRVNHVIIELIILGASESKQYINLALCPHVAKDVLHEMGLATCRLAVYADNERRPQTFHSCYSIYTTTSKKQAVNGSVMGESWLSNGGLTLYRVLGWYDGAPGHTFLRPQWVAMILASLVF